MTNRRRSERFEIELPVRLKDARGGEETVTIDVSAHGIAIYAAKTKAMRQYAELEIVLPEPVRKINVTAMVARTLGPIDGSKVGRPSRGLGLEFFLFDAHAKQEWQDFIRWVRVQDPSAISTRAASFTWADLPTSAMQSPHSSENVPTFLVRPRDLQRLITFQRRELSSGIVRMEAPQIQADGTKVEVVVVHPLTVAECGFEGRVRRTFPHRTRPSVVEIELLGLDAAKRALFENFVQRGDRLIAEEISISGDVRVQAIPVHGHSDQGSDEWHSVDLTDFSLEVEMIPESEIPPREFEEAREALDATLPGTVLPALNSGFMTPLDLEPPPLGLPVSRPLEPTPLVSLETHDEARSVLAAASHVQPIFETAPTVDLSAQPELLAPDIKDLTLVDDPRRVFNPRSDPDPELTAARMLVARNPHSITSLYLLGTLLLRRDDDVSREEAIITLKRLMELEPNHPGAQHAMADALARRGDFVVASEHIQRARRLGYQIDPKLLRLINERKRLMGG